MTNTGCVLSRGGVLVIKKLSCSGVSVSNWCSCEAKAPTAWAGTLPLPRHERSDRGLGGSSRLLFHPAARGAFQIGSRVFNPILGTKSPNMVCPDPPPAYQRPLTHHGVYHGGSHTGINSSLQISFQRGRPMEELVLSGQGRETVPSHHGSLCDPGATPAQFPVPRQMVR